MIATHGSLQSPDIQDAQGWNHLIHSRAWQAHALWCLGYPTRALEQGLEAIRLADGLAEPFNQAIASAYLALLHQLCSDAETAKASAEAGQTVGVEYKAPYYRAWADVLVQHAQAWEEPTALHLARLRKSITDLQATGARLRMPYYLWLLALTHQKAGQIEEGLLAIDEALTESRIHSERWWDAELHRLRGELMQARGYDVREVEAALRRAVAIAGAQQARSLELRAATSLARLLQAQNRVDEAQSVLGDVYAWFTEGFDTPDLQAARSLLAELA